MTREREGSGATRFVADAMFARLARWLRALGFDTLFDPALHDRELVALADAEGRVLLTRDRHLVEHLRPERALLITTRAPLAQLEEVIAACALEPQGRIFSRCLVCNGELRAASPQEVGTLAPESARDAPGPIRRCSRCGRLYWPGSHTRRMRAVLGARLPEWL